MTHVVRGHWGRRILELRAFMRANFTASESRVDGGASVSWKLLNRFRLRPNQRPLTTSSQITDNCAPERKKCMRRTLTQQKLLAPSEYHCTDRIGWKTISPPSNWPKQSTFETRRHNHFKCCTRTVARKFSIGGLCCSLFSGGDLRFVWGLDKKLTINPLINSISRFDLGGLGDLLGGAQPTKGPRGHVTVLHY